MNEDLAFAGISAAGAALRDGRTTARGLAEAQLARIEALDGHLNSYITVCPEEALAQADAADRALAAGEDRGALQGIPLALKDLIATKDILTTGGSLLFKDWRPTADAPIAVRLKEAGAVILGKTNLHELAYGSTSINPHFGPIANPWRLDHHPGGSSGGSAAAVAAGLAFGAIGSDTGCSIRQPAHCCGIVGLKPTFGRVSKADAIPLSWSMDHLGPITRSVRDAALVLQAIAGHDPADPNTVEVAVDDYSRDLDRGIEGLRIGLVREFFFEDCEPAIAAAVEAAAGRLAALGARVEELVLPHMADAYAMGNLIIVCEAATYHGEHMDSRPEAFSEEVRASIAMGRGYGATDYIQAQRIRRRITEATLATMAAWDCAIMPTSPVTATPIAATPREHVGLRHRNCIPFDLTGLPALSLPCGLDDAGLPIGLQIVTGPFQEAMALRIAQAYEATDDWPGRRPAGLAALETSGN